MSLAWGQGQRRCILRYEPKSPRARHIVGTLGALTARI